MPSGASRKGRMRKKGETCCSQYGPDRQDQDGREEKKIQQSIAGTSKNAEIMFRSRVYVVVRPRHPSSAPPTRPSMSKQAVHNRGRARPPGRLATRTPFLGKLCWPARLPATPLFSTQFPPSPMLPTETRAAAGCSHGESAARGFGLDRGGWGAPGVVHLLGRSLLLLLLSAWLSPPSRLPDLVVVILSISRCRSTRCPALTKAGRQVGVWQN